MEKFVPLIMITSTWSTVLSCKQGTPSSLTCDNISQ